MFTMHFPTAIPRRLAHLISKEKKSKNIVRKKFVVSEYFAVFFGFFNEDLCRSIIKTLNQMEIYTFLTITSYYTLPLSCTLFSNAYLQYIDSTDLLRFSSIYQALSLHLEG